MLRIILLHCVTYHPISVCCLLFYTNGSVVLQHGVVCRRVFFSQWQVACCGPMLHWGRIGTRRSCMLSHGTLLLLSHRTGVLFCGKVLLSCSNLVFVTLSHI